MAKAKGRAKKDKNGNAVVRDEKGRIPAGVSGNPAGRPKSKRNRITELKQDMEIAIRNHMDPDKIKAIIDAMVVEAVGGSVGAAKLLLDKTVSNAKSDEEDSRDGGGIQVVIRNVTAKIEQPETTEVLEAEYEESTE